VPSVFLCHTASDKPFVARLAADLKRASVEVWYDNWEIRPGDSIIEKVSDGLSNNDYLAIVLSPASVESRWVKREINASLMRNLSAQSIKLLPLLFIPCEIPSLIADLRYVDFTESYEQGFIDLQIALGLLNPIPAYSSRPASIVSVVDRAPSDSALTTLFPATFSDYPQCLLTESLADLAIIVGSTPREKSDESKLFGESTLELDVLGTRWQFSRQNSPGTVRDLVRVVDLVASLVAFQAAAGGPVLADFSQDALCRADVAVTESTLRKNIILVGAADTNVFFSLATVTFMQRFGYTLPIRYSGDDRLYFTCDQVYSELSGNTYSRLEESGYMHCGYIVMVANPWAPDKLLILASGTRATGTQAALLALIHRQDDVVQSGRGEEPWRSLAGNNRYYPSIPAKVVRATRAEIIPGRSLIARGRAEVVPPDNRISQRHLITGFEFLE